MTIQTFTLFFWTLAGIIIVMMINEEKLLKLEAEYDRRRAEKKRQKAQRNTTRGKNR